MRLLLLLTTRGVEYELRLLLGRVYDLLCVVRVVERVYAWLPDVAAALVDGRVVVDVVPVVLLLSDSTFEFVPDFDAASLDVEVVLRLLTLASFVPATFDLLSALELDAEIADEPLALPPRFTFVSVDLLCPYVVSRPLPG